MEKELLFIIPGIIFHVFSFFVCFSTFILINCIIMYFDFNLFCCEININSLYYCKECGLFDGYSVWGSAETMFFCVCMQRTYMYKGGGELKFDRGFPLGGHFAYVPSLVHLW